MAQKNILVVDDDSDIRESFCGIAYLHDHGQATFKIASNPHEAIALITDQAFVPEIVLSDFNMPGMDGLMFLKSLVARGVKAKMAIMTTDPRLRGAVEAAGFTFYRKPISPKEIIRFLELS